MHKRLRLRIEKCVLGGEGLGYSDGKTVFVENSLPGETVEVRVISEKKDWSRATVLKVLERSPARVEPRCRYYGRCGGCQYQHADYAQELLMKEGQVREVMEKLAGIKGKIRNILHGSQSYGYRRSATFRVIRKKRAGASSFAYISKDNVTPIEVKSCDLLHPSIGKILEEPPRMSADTVKVSFKVSSGGKVHSDEKEVFFHVVLSGHRLLVSSQAFFQNNWEVTELISKKISEVIAELRPGTFVDLYAGVGTFTFLSAKNVPRIVCIEENPHAVETLRMNREESGWSQIEVHEGRVERVFEKLWRGSGAADSVIFLDPPRQGMDAKLAHFLAKDVKAKGIVYVSCDPATLARDLKTLLAPGKWVLGEVIPYDMFPRTKHVEAAAFLYYNVASEAGS